MKNIITLGIIAVLAIAGYVIGTRLQGSEEDVTQDRSASSERGERGAVDRGNRNRDSALHVRGRVMSVSDTEIVVGTYAGRESGRNAGVDREQIQAMSEQERETFRAQREAERDAQGEPEITGEKVVVITDETIFVKGRGRERGQRQDENEGSAANTQSEPEQIDPSEIEEGMTITVTLREGTQEAAIISVQEQR